MMYLRGAPISFPADPSLTSSRMSATLERVSVDDVGSILQIPVHKQSQLKAQHTNEGDRRFALTDYYLQTHPRASWALVAGKCLLWEEEESALRKVVKREESSEESALREVVKRVKCDEGMEVCMAGPCSHAHVPVSFSA